ncbi:root allergen protein [Lactuca sativa]|uniref:root allergen protein n=1 Tax=Lactuca sativa TaxID=4236 RepID=UPI0022AF029D|nr:root allergen protein [Lactuca sativa]
MEALELSGTSLLAMLKLDVVDSNNFSIIYTIFEGDILMGQLDSMTHHVKFIPSPDGGCVYKPTVVYNCKGETQLPEEALNMVKEGFKKTFNAIEGLSMQILKLIDQCYIWCVMFLVQ